MIVPTIFISYSHKDEKWKDRLVSQLGVLEQVGALNLWDDQRIGAGEDWYKEIEEAINKAAIAVLLVTASFLTSNFILSEEIPRLLQRRDKEGLKIFPIIVRPCPWQEVKWLARMQVRPKHGKPLSGGRAHQIEADIASIASEIARLVKRAESTPKNYPVMGPDKVSTAKLPSTNPTLFGREKELRVLDEAWMKQDINILSLVAWGGVGKTALVNQWLARVAKDNYRGAERVYGWSFYSQGAREESEISADLFIAAALAWFGDPDPTRGSPWDKGGRLAELIKQQRTLLILDGLEPLQNSTPVEIGKIKDLGLRSLLRELARQNPGLVIITTRLTVDDLKDFIGDSAIEINLDNLSPEAGVLYLEHLGVKGLPNELTKATHEFGGHALALTILGHYLVDVHDADIRKRDLIPNLTVEEEKGGHAKRIMEAYEKWFEEQPESEILYLMGLFDRPAEKGAIDALLAEPVIDGLTNELQALPTENYRLALKHLRRARLLAQQDPHEPNVLDCHPLLREHFGEKLKAVNPIAWRDAHSRLYEYYKSSAKEFPDTIEEMVVLYAAVTHGCLAGRYQEALDVYWERILRGEKHFSWKKLGSHGADLAALNGFFDSAWHRITEVLSEDDKLFIMGQVGLYLRALGRLMEAVSPMQSSMDLAILENDWLNAAVQANNLSELHLFIGNTTQAVSYASRCIEFADNSGNPLWQVISRSTHANVLHQRGLFVEAEIAFTEAEERQKKGRHPILCYLRGFQYCDLLISQRKYQEVIRRATQTLNWTIQEYTEGSVGPLEIALDNLSLGRAHLRSTQLKSDDLFIESGNYLNNAVDGLRQAGEQIYIPRGLLARAEFYRLTGAHDKAQKDLDEVFTITSHGGTKLYLADYHLEYARLYLANGDKANALEQWKIAKDMIEKTGYHRRDNEVEEFEEQLK